MNEVNYERRQFEAENEESFVPTFGRPTRNNGWIKCKSKSLRGKSYYYNVDSCCRTWRRPISRELPTIVNTASSQNDEYFWDASLIDVSDIEDDAEEVSDKANIEEKLRIIGVREAKKRQIFAEVFFKLYHCYGDDNCKGDEIIESPTKNKPALICKTEFVEDKDAADEIPTISPETCYSSSSDEGICDASTRINRKRYSAEHTTIATTMKRPKYCETKKRKNEAIWGTRSNWPNASNTGLVSTRDSIDRPVADFWTGSLDNASYPNHSDSDEASMRFESNSDDDEEKMKSEEDDEDIGDDSRAKKPRFFLPRLKAIEFSDLITTDPATSKLPRKKNVSKRRGAATPVVRPPKKMAKLIYEMNGVKTINYDFVEPELPPGVRASNLSDSGSSSLGIAYNRWTGDTLSKNSRELVETKYRKVSSIKDDFMDIEGPCLSDCSSSNSSSSSEENGTAKRSNASYRRSRSDARKSSGSNLRGDSMSRPIQTPMESISEQLTEEKQDSGGTCTTVRKKFFNGGCSERISDGPSNDVD